MEWIKIFVAKIDLTSVLIAFFLITGGSSMIIISGQSNQFANWVGTGMVSVGSILSILSWLFNSMKEHFQSSMKVYYDDLIKKYIKQVSVIQKSNKELNSFQTTINNDYGEDLKPKFKSIAIDSTNSN
jgi:hypothetical protein